MARIRMIEEPDATGTVKSVYDRAQQQLGFVPNVRFAEEFTWRDKTQTPF